MPEENPVALPLGGATISGTEITIDDFVNPPSRIPAIIRNLVAENEGYFIESLFQTPGFTVEGGAIIYEESFPEDHFLPEDQSIAPRAPLTESPTLGSTRRAPKISRPESWAGTIVVSDEARRRNRVIAVQRQFTQASNTFADRIQTRGIQTLNGAITEWGRTIPGVNWRQAYASGIDDADPQTLPQRDFAAVIEQFTEDKAGVLPNLLLLHHTDAFHLDVLYGEKLGPLLQRYNLTMRISPQVTEGEPIFARSGEVGYLAFEKPLDQEYERLSGGRYGDAYHMEAVPVFVADNAAAVLKVTGVDSA